MVKQWQYGSQLTTDWHINSPIKFHNEWEGKSFDQWGKVLEFEQYQRIKYSLFAPRQDLEDKLENYFFMTYRLEENKGSTILTITQDDPRPGAEQGDDNEAGNAMLTLLKNLVELS